MTCLPTLKRWSEYHQLSYFALVAVLWAMLSQTAIAEGSKDFLAYPGYRLFFWAEKQQQMKVYANTGEFINVGSSHVGISGGFIRVFRPDGTLVARFDDTGASAGLAIIDNDVEEKNGPNGGGATQGQGYIPGVIQVGPGEAGVWTVTFEYPTYTGTGFENLLNSDSWTRLADQPTNRRVVLAWDITVTKGGAGNTGGGAVEGRVYSNEYNSIVSRNGNTCSPIFYIMTKDGFQYEVKFTETDPWGFPIFSNSVGIVNGAGQPQYVSKATAGYERSADPSAWLPDQFYLYEPQAKDFGSFINNKVFFNLPDAFMPASAMVTDIFRNETYSTWLQRIPQSVKVDFGGFSVASFAAAGAPCQPNTLEVGTGGYFKFTSNESGNAELFLDLNDNGSFTDPEDRRLYKYIEVGTDSIYWDLKNGLGEPLPEQYAKNINIQLNLHGGEVHILMSDVENNPGGVTISLINDLPIADPNLFYYNHIPIGGPKSGGPDAPYPLPTSQAFTYNNNFGNEKLLDYWTFVDFDGAFKGKIIINIVRNCSTPSAPDFDGDGVVDTDDIDDDNDGVPDKWEFCNPSGGFGCFVSGLDPSGDADGDGRLNYLDADDPDVANICDDLNADGICDRTPAEYDTDSDGVSDHLDLDSDNDGITDLVEAGHAQVDADGNGVIDGLPLDFGTNGLFNPIETGDSLSANATYARWDWDSDGVPDHDDLDSDNDGIKDVAEAGYSSSDSDNDGRIDDGRGNVPKVSLSGLVPLIDPTIIKRPIPNPPDWDGDQVPDWHDLDSDNDGINDVREANRPDPDNDGFIGQGRPRVDVNGLATADAAGRPLTTTSNPVDTDGDRTPDFHDLDSDGDGITDVHEAQQPDPDDDGIIGFGLPFTNDFGQPTVDRNNNPIRPTSNPRDWDGDGAADFQDIDRDNDGIVDSYECETGHPCPDTDRDGTPDVDDLDSDNDQAPDRDECIGGAICPDDNQNQIDNFREYNCNRFTTPVLANLSGNGAFCTGDDITLTANNSVAATDSVTYTWSGPGGFFFTRKVSARGPFELTVNNATPATTGIYRLVIESTRGCRSNPGEVFIEVKPKPALPVLSPLDDHLCEGENLLLQAPFYQGDAVTYSWYYSDGANTRLLTTTRNPVLQINNVRQAQSGLYTVGVTIDGCTSDISDQAAVAIYTKPAVRLVENTTTSTNPACEGDAVTLRTNWIEGATYEWVGPGGYISNRFNPELLNVSMLDAGQYFVVVTKDGCSTVSPSTEVFINPRPLPPTIAVPKPVCEGSTLDLVISGTGNPQGAGVSYQWFRSSDGARVGTTTEPRFTFSRLSANDAGNYFVVLTLNGCASGRSPMQQVRVDVVPDEKAYISNDLLYTCTLDDILISATPSDKATGHWTTQGGATIQNPADASTIAFDLPAGNNFFIWQLSNGACINFDRDTLLVVHEQDAVIANDDEFILKFNQTLSSGAILVNDFTGDVKAWHLEIVDLPLYGNLERNPDGSFTYTQKVNFFGTDRFVYRLCNDNCPDQCDEAIVIIRTEGIGQNGDCFIPNYITPNDDGSNDAFTIPCLDDQFLNNEMMIFNRWGDKVFEAKPYRNDWTGLYRNAPLPPGTYFYCLRFSPDKEPVQGFITIFR